jgi:hypothetical protein
MARRSHARRRQALLCRPSRRWLETRPFAFRGVLAGICTDLYLMLDFRSAATGAC